MVRNQLHEDSTRSAYELTCKLAADIRNDPTDEEELPIATTAIDARISERAGDDQNVVFGCSFLVDVETCDMQSDFETTKNACSFFSFVQLTPRSSF